MATDSGGRVNIFGQYAAHGFGNDTADWRDRSACLGAGEDWFSEQRNIRAAVIHICRSHCPVLTECLASTEQEAPLWGIQAGVLWTNDGGSYKVGAPSKYQPEDQGHQRECDTPPSRRLGLAPVAAAKVARGEPQIGNGVWVVIAA